MQFTCVALDRISRAIRGRTLSATLKFSPLLALSLRFETVALVAITAQ